MKMWMKVAIVTLVVAIPATLLGNVIWLPAEGGPSPTGGQLPFFIVLEIITTFTLGLGVAFLIFGLPSMKEISAGSTLRAWTMYLSIGWLLVSWWPHQHMHISNGDNMAGLLVIEYGFHVTLMLSALALVFCLISLLRKSGAPMAAS